MQYHDTDRIKMGDADWSVQCLQCGKQFEARRSDATFCSARCRVAYSREPEKFRNAVESVNSMASQLLTLSRKYKSSNEMYQAMLQLQRDLGAAISNFEQEK